MVVTVEDTAAINYPELRVGVNGAVKAINASGGIKGRLLDPVFCNEKRDPSTAVACAQQAGASDIVSLVASAAPDANVMLPLLEASGTADFGGQGANLAEYKSSVAFMTGGAGLDTQLGIAKAYIDDGVKSVNTMYIDAPTAVPTVIEHGLAACGVKVNAKVTVPFGDPDPSSQVAQVLQGDPGGVVAVLDAGSQTALIRGIAAESGHRPALAILDFNLPQSQVNELGSAANGIKVVGAFPPASATNVPGMSDFIKAMGGSSDPDIYQPAAMTGYANVELFAAIAKTLPTVTKSSFLSALKKGVGPINSPFYTNFSTKSPKVSVPGIGVDYGSNAWISEVENGKIQLLSNQPVDTSNLC